MPIEANGNFKLRPYNTTRERLVDVNSVKGAKLMAQTSMIEGELTERPDGVGVEDLRAISGEATIQIDLSNGQKWVMYDGIFTETGELETEEGKVKVKFESAKDMVLL